MYELWKEDWEVSLRSMQQLFGIILTGVILGSQQTSRIQNATAKKNGILKYLIKELSNRSL